MTSTLAIQDRYFPDLMCFGCGPANPKGLRIKSFAQPDGSVLGRFRPWPEHDNGLGYLNGGIIATLLDCNSAAAVSVESERLGLPPDGSLQYVTAGLDVSFRRPTPLDEELELQARVLDSSEAELRIETEIVWDGKQRAVATALWKRWRPRVAQP